MQMHKRGMVLALAGLLFAGVTGSARAEFWTTDYKAAAAAAAADSKYMLVNFSGSDWCGWCIRLDKEVFSQEVFTTFAGTRFVPVLLDFPRRTPQSDDLKRQNQEILEKYDVRGFPTVLILDAEGKLLAKTGYRPGGAEAYVAHLKEILAAQSAPVAPVAPGEGVDKPVEAQP